MIGNEGGIEYHEEPIEYHDQECYFFSRLRLKYAISSSLYDCAPSKVRFRAIINIAIPYSILFRRCLVTLHHLSVHHIVKCLQENLRRSVRLVILSWCYDTLPILHFSLHK